MRDAQDDLVFDGGYRLYLFPLHLLLDIYLHPYTLFLPLPSIYPPTPLQHILNDVGEHISNSRISSLLDKDVPWRCHARDERMLMSPISNVVMGRGWKIGVLDVAWMMVTCGAVRLTS